MWKLGLKTHVNMLKAARLEGAPEFPGKMGLDPATDLCGAKRPLIMSIISFQLLFSVSAWPWVLASSGVSQSICVQSTSTNPIWWHYIIFVFSTVRHK